MSSIPPDDPHSTPSSPLPSHPQGMPGYQGPPQLVVQSPPSLFGRYGKLLVLALGIVIICLLGLSAAYQSYFSEPGGPQEKYHSLSKTGDKKIAIILVSGTIMEGDGFIKKQIDQVRRDDSVVGVVLRINSPGGTVTGSDYLYHHLSKLMEERELPLVVSMGSMCASGGYYLAMAVGDQGEAVFAEPTTWTGSIGVVIPHYDLSGLLTRFDIKDDSIASHKYKLMGSPTRLLSSEDRTEQQAMLQTLVDISFDRFKDIVRQGRPKFQDDADALDKVATGQIFTAQQALELGLVDKIGFIEMAIERVATLSGHDLDKLRCVKYDKPVTMLGTLMGSYLGKSPQATGVDLHALLNLTAPQAYYLCAGLPLGPSPAVWAP
ncbi:MAG: signal peptide peptidase SppA [Pirellulales bacterium]